MSDIHVPSHAIIDAIDAHELLGLDAPKQAALQSVLCGGTVAIGGDGTWAILQGIFARKNSPSLAALAVLRSQGG